MKIELKTNSLVVTKDATDKKFHGGWGSAESQLLHHIKKTLISAGYDVIKKRMAKDGHLYGDDTTQYIRSRKIGKGTPYMMIYDGQWAIRNLATEWNETGKVTLLVERGIGQ